MKVHVKEKNRGITLIALVVTIIVLLILAGVTISTLTGDNGILTKSSQAKEETLYSQTKESLDLIVQELLIEQQSDNVDSKEFLKTKFEEEGMELIWEFKNDQTYWKYNNLIIRINLKNYTEYSIENIVPNTIIQNNENNSNMDGGFLIDISQGGIPKEDIISFKVSNEIPTDYSISYDVSQMKDESVKLYAVTDDEMRYYVTLVPKSGSEIFFPPYCNQLFQRCTNIREIDLTNVNTSNVINMQHMFYGCTSLENVNIANIDTSNVIRMSTMFFNCASLQTLDLSGFNTSNVKFMNSMFRDSRNLTTIYIGSNWTSENADTTDMFKNCGTSELIFK